MNDLKQNMIEKDLDEYLQECQIKKQRLNPGRNRAERRKWNRKRKEYN